MRAEKKAADAAYEADVAAVLANAEKLLAANQEKWRQQELVLEEERRAMDREMEERARRRKQLLKENEERRVAGEEEAILSRKVSEKMAALNGAANFLGKWYIVWYFTLLINLGFLYDTYQPRALPDTSTADKAAAEQLNSHGRSGGFASRGSGRGGRGGLDGHGRLSGRGGRVEPPARPDNSSQYAQDFVSEVKTDDVPAAEKAAEDCEKAKPWQTASEAAAEASSLTPAPAAPAASQAAPTPTATSGTLDGIKLSEADQRAALEDD